jgi:drug/metabolite transporter (DMT)-like permease
MSQAKRGTLLVILSAISFGVMPFLITKIYAYGCSPATVLLFRQLLPIPLFLALGRRDVRRTVAERGRALTAASIFSGVLTPLLLLNSYLYIASGTATTLHFIYPMFVFLIEITVLRRPFRADKLLCYALCAVGVALLQGGGTITAPIGVVLALTSGVTYAIFIVLLERADVGSYSPFAVNAVILSVSVVCTFLYGLLTRTLTFRLPWQAYLQLIVLAFLIAIAGSMFFQIGVAKVGGQRAAIFSCLEPITSVLCGVLFLKERLTLPAACGTILILAAITGSVLIDGRAASAAPAEKN